MFNQVYAAVTDILSKEQSKRGIQYGDCPPGLSMELENAIHNLAETIENVLAAQQAPMLEAVIYRHGSDDLEIWQIDLTEDERAAVEHIFENARDRGASARGSRADIAAEIFSM